MCFFYRSKERSILIQTKIIFFTGCCKTQSLDDCFCVQPTSTDKNTSFFRTIRNIQTLKFWPFTFDSRPRLSHPRPMTLDMRPSTCNPRPSTCDPWLATLGSRLATLDLLPSTLDNYPNSVGLIVPLHLSWEKGQSILITFRG